MRNINSVVKAADDHDHEEGWKDCEIFLAPSSMKGGGWGVYAGRDFEEREIVELSPRVITMPFESSIILNSALNDYLYGYLRWNAERREMDHLAAVVFGGVMMYNHNAKPNIKWTGFGQNPGAVDPNLSQASGFVAGRKIEAGEELFTSYGEEDGGEMWFEDRRIKQIHIPAYESRKNGTVYEKDKAVYCTKVYSGYGRPAWENGVIKSYKSFNGEDAEFPFKLSSQRLSPKDHPSAIVKRDVDAGAVLEISPALILSLPKIFMTALAPMGFYWDDWDEIQQEALKNLRANGDFIMQYQGQNTFFERVDRFKYFEDIVVFPFAGNIALVDRVSNNYNNTDDEEEANCMIKIVSSGSMKSHSDRDEGVSGNAGILLKLIATKSIKVGEKLKLNIPSNPRPSENLFLTDNLKRLGQPIPNHLNDFLRS